MRQTRTGSLIALVRFVFVSATLLCVTGTERVEAQDLTRTWLTWRTIETTHFALHYPTELEGWTQRVASQMEAIDSAVTRLVGNTPGKRVHIVVDDPYALANGSAWPLMDAPAIQFWATPPSPEDELGSFTDWGQLLAVHEFTHIAHLTRPSRDPVSALLWNLLPAEVGPIARNSPRWIIEGYATYIEGALTHSGRPNGAWRPAVLREWALEGQLPSYEQLDTGTGYLGGSFAYLAGSAFLQWLADQHGDSSLVQLWRRMSARVDRPFEAAFSGTFGEPAAVLYGRFTAELTVEAAEARKRILATGVDTGSVVQHLARATGDPAMSSDGGKIALVIRSATRGPRVVIWKTTPEPDTAAQRARAELLKRDPEDVPGRSIYPPPKKSVAELPGVGTSAYEDPRFFRDGRLLLWRNTAQGDGSFRPDLYIWDPQRHRVTRVTHGAGIQQGDPSPDGLTAVATQCVGGTCSVVQVDLTTGVVHSIIPPDLTRVYDRPRYSVDGKTILVAVHDKSWRLALVALDGTLRGYIGPNDGANRYDAAFVDSTTVVAVSDVDGLPSIERIDVRTGAAHTIARAFGAALAPEPNPADGSIWFLSMHSRGLDVRMVAKPVPTFAVTPLTLDTFPRVSGQPPALPLPPTGGQEPQGHPYGLGPRVWRWLPAAETGADGTSGLLSLFNTDVVGRTELLVQGVAGRSGTWNGASATLTSRATRPTFSFSAFGIRQTMSDRQPAGTIADSMDSRLVGGIGWLEFSRAVETSSRRLILGASSAEVRVGSEPTTSRSMAFAQGSVAFRHLNASNSTTLTLRAQGSGGEIGTDRVERGIFTGSLAFAGPNGIPLTLSGLYGAVSTTSSFERFSIGGSPAAVVEPVLLAQRIALPALPTGIDGGDQVETYRATLPLGGLNFYSWGARAHHESGTFGSWQRVDGAEWSGSLPAYGTSGTPTVSGTIGVGKPNGPADRRHPLLYIMIGIGDWWGKL